MITYTKSIHCFILYLLITVFVAGCRGPDSQPTVTAAQYPVGTTTSVPVIIGKPEPTPTTAVCTPLPADMALDIQYESDLHGVIEVTGLQPGEKPTLLLTGEAQAGSWRKDTQYENAVEANGRLSYRFDFRSWPSVDGYTFTGQLIHQRGVVCFDLEIPLVEPPPSLDETAVSPPALTTTQTPDTEAIIARLEILQNH